MRTAEMHCHCKDCQYWKVSVKAGQVQEYSKGRYPLPKIIRCTHMSQIVGRMDTCPEWENVPVDPTCYNCIHLDRDDGRAHLYGYGFCTFKHQNQWVNVETKRISCKHHEFRGNQNENKKSK